jgi:hypothetical protein
MVGEQVSGPLRLLLSVDDYGYLWVNGESLGHFPWNGDFEITKNARPGQKFIIAIKAINTGGPLRLIRAQLKPGRESPLARALDDFALGIKAAQKLLSFDTYQTNATKRADPGTDKSHMERAEKTRLNQLLQSTAASVNIDALKQGRIGDFTASLDAARATLSRSTSIPMPTSTRPGYGGRRKPSGFAATRSPPC